MHKIDAPAYHPTTFKRLPGVYLQGVRIVFDPVPGSVYIRGARVRAKVVPSIKLEV
jgi:hypothetical protein